MYKYKLDGLYLLWHLALLSNKFCKYTCNDNNKIIHHLKKAYFQNNFLTLFKVNTYARTMH